VEGIITFKVEVMVEVKVEVEVKSPVSTLALA